MPQLAAPALSSFPARLDRRTTFDRRRAPTPMLSRFTLIGGRRRRGRRDGEMAETYVDQHGAFLLTAVVWLTALNFLDAWFTVLLLSHGGQEMNPLVDSLLGYGLWPFLLAKSLGVGLCGAFLTLTKNFRASQVGLVILVAGYSLLLWWHLHLTGFISWT